MPVTKPPCTIIPFECVRSTEGEKSHTNESSSMSLAPLNPRISKNGGISLKLSAKSLSDVISVSRKMAEGVGFEPTVPMKARRFSRPLQ